MKKKRFFNKESSILTLIYRFIFTKFCAFDGKIMIDAKKNLPFKCQKYFQIK